VSEASARERSERKRRRLFWRERERGEFRLFWRERERGEFRLFWRERERGEFRSFWRERERGEFRLFGRPPAAPAALRSREKSVGFARAPRLPPGPISPGARVRSPAGGGGSSPPAAR
jgi:hypothetical protein